MTFGQIKEYKVKNTFLKYHAENVAEKLVLDPLLLFNKTLYEVNASGQHLSFNVV